MASRVEAKHGFPGFAGALDGSHIPVPAPPKHARPLSYYNGKNREHSIILQAVADDRLFFRYVRYCFV